MKKILYTLFIGIILIICPISVSAAVTKYQPNVFTDETTIEEDFKNLNIDINDYYKPKNYNYQKWYVIAMSEGYANTDSFDIQTYFYLFNPSEYGTKDNYMTTVASIYMTYKIGEEGQEVKNASVLKLDYDQEHLIYKVKGFTYSFSERSEIYITQIQHYNFYGSGITSDSGFKAVANHSKLNGFAVELNFNTTLILEEYEAVDVYIPRDDRGFFNKLANFWDDIWLGGSKDLWLTFYNFNFPKHIKPDSIEYAKFSYNVTYNQIHMINGTTKSDDSSTKKEIKEYTPGTHTFQANGRSEELTFQTFVLGDRIKKGEFGYLEFTEEAKKKFNYDASILLDSRINTFSTAMLNEYTSSTFIKRTSISDIEFLEMHYKKDGILYKCQIVSQPVDPTPIRPTVKKTWWEKFLEFLIKMFDFIFFEMFGLSFWIPDIGKQIASGIILFIGGLLAIFVVIPFILKMVIKCIRILFRRE